MHAVTSRAALALALVLATFAAYSNSFTAGFTFDNKGLLLQDPRIQEVSAANFDAIVQHTYWWPHGESGLYRPATTLTYLFNYAVLGNAGRPAGYHAVNLLLHVINVLLVYWIARRLIGGDGWTAALIAGLWAVHPLSVEAVTNIVGRADLLAAFGVLLGLVAYIRATETTGRRAWAWRVVLLVVTLLGVFSKESAVAIVGVIVVYELAFGSSRRTHRDLVRGLAVVAISLAVMWYQRAAVFAAAPPSEFPYLDNPIGGASFWTGRLTAIDVLARYLRLAAWPARLSCDYSYAAVPLARGTAGDWLALAVIGAAAAATVALFRRHRTAFFAAACAFVTILPASNLIVTSGTIMAERLMYLPLAGIAGCVVCAIVALARRVRVPALAPVVLSIAIVALGVRTWVRNADWRDDVTLWTAAAAAQPDSYKTHRALAGALFEIDPAHATLGRVLAEADRAIVRIDPVPDALNDAAAFREAATYYLVEGDRLDQGAPGVPSAAAQARRQAIALLERSIRISDAASARLVRERPDSTVTAAAAAQDAGALRRISATWLRLSDPGQALAAALRARDAEPASADGYRAWAQSLVAAGRPEDASVALMTGVLITDEPQLRSALLDLYRSGLDEAGCAILPGSATALNPQCEIVHRALCAASAEAIRIRLETGRSDLAENLRATAARLKCADR